MDCCGGTACPDLLVGSAKFSTTASSVQIDEQMLPADWQGEVKKRLTSCKLA